ncbi:putative ATP-grasp-modified RiPP [Streptomyces sp. CAU 1734]|uniref:putative ATP-grasp-modified RiPP n=1 Tax=Streptomyces sp. CAU 1734 TaxID=3140360 RepID=UPI00325FF363
MAEGSAMPWGLTRMRPFPEGEPTECTTVVLDPETQMGRWFDADGEAVPGEGKHKKPSTYRETKPRTSLDGNRDEGRDQETD